MGTEGGGDESGIGRREREYDGMGSRKGSGMRGGRKGRGKGNGKRKEGGGGD